MKINNNYVRKDVETSSRKSSLLAFNQFSAAAIHLEAIVSHPTTASSIVRSRLCIPIAADHLNRVDRLLSAAFGVRRSWFVQLSFTADLIIGLEVYLVSAAFETRHQALRGNAVILEVRGKVNAHCLQKLFQLLQMHLMEFLSLNDFAIAAYLQFGIVSSLLAAHRIRRSRLNLQINICI